MLNQSSTVILGALQDPIFDSFHSLLTQHGYHIIFPPWVTQWHNCLWLYVNLRNALLVCKRFFCNSTSLDCLLGHSEFATGFARSHTSDDGADPALAAILLTSCLLFRSHCCSLQAPSSPGHFRFWDDLLWTLVETWVVKDKKKGGETITLFKLFLKLHKSCCIISSCPVAALACP